MKWKDKLTKKELKHLRDVKIYTLEHLKTTRQFQKQMREINIENNRPGDCNPCRACQRIAVKLGLELTKPKEADMTGQDIAIIADILEELKIRWRGDLSHANKPNVLSFLSFRLRERVPEFDRKRFVAHILTKEV